MIEAKNEGIASSSTLERSVRSVTILFTDVVGFAPLTERLGDVLAYQAMQRHHQIVRERIGVHDGEEVELRGDSFFVVFDSPHSALRCAVDLQHALEAEAQCNAGPGVHIRAGLHAGHAIQIGCGYFGRDVIIAARISALAGPGQILISSELAARLPEAPGIPVGPEKRLKLKGLAGVYGVYELGWRVALSTGYERPATAVAVA